MYIYTYYIHIFNYTQIDYLRIEIWNNKHSFDMFMSHIYSD